MADYNNGVFVTQDLPDSKLDGPASSSNSSDRLLTVVAAVSPQ